MNKFNQDVNNNNAHIVVQHSTNNDSRCASKINQASNHIKDRWYKKLGRSAFVLSLTLVFCSLNAMPTSQKEPTHFKLSHSQANKLADTIKDASNNKNIKKLRLTLELEMNPIEDTASNKKQDDDKYVSCENVALEMAEAGLF